VSTTGRPEEYVSGVFWMDMVMPWAVGCVRCFLALALGLR
jgi:hypothetical protein